MRVPKQFTSIVSSRGDPPIELEVFRMEPGVHILESVDLDQTVLGLVQVTAIPMR